jgi:hypothetical protein
MEVGAVEIEQIWLLDTDGTITCELGLTYRSIVQLLGANLWLALLVL